MCEQKPYPVLCERNREEMSLHHVAMVAKFLDERHLTLYFIDFIQFLLTCQILATFLGLHPKGRYLSSQNGRETFYVVCSRAP